MRERPCAACFESNCGASCLSSLSKFQTAASAVNSEPSWYIAPLRIANVHRVRSLSSTFHAVARPGTSSAAFVADERSQLISAS